MTRKSHYTILGISKGASPEGVRAAFLRLAKERHPDRAGEASTPAFREIQQAYDVLSDPERRRRYDRQFDQKRRTSWSRPEPLTQHHRVEPIVPDPDPQPQRRSRRRPTFDDLSELVGKGFTPDLDRPLRPIDGIDVDVVISAGLADRGGRCTVNLPFREICGHCLGTGIRWPSPCPACRQSGWTTNERSVGLELPPGIQSGTVIHLRSRSTGGAGIRLRLLVRQGRRAPPFW